MLALSPPFIPVATSNPPFSPLVHNSLTSRSLHMTSLLISPKKLNVSGRKFQPSSCPHPLPLLIYHITEPCLSPSDMFSELHFRCSNFCTSSSLCSTKILFYKADAVWTCRENQQSFRTNCVITINEFPSLLYHVTCASSMPPTSQSI